MKEAIEDPRKKFIDLIDLDKSRVQLEPHIVFICGGPVDASATTNHSVRNMFMNLSGQSGGITDGFVLAENFKDWHDGYNNLSEFENDIAYISSMVVIFLESEGALTEFGLFFGNCRLRDKLVAIIHSEFHNNESFINFGLLNPMENTDQSSVKVFTIDHRDIDTISINEVKEILEDIVADCQKKDNTVQFDITNRGHQIFLIFQIISIFQALTKSEIREYVERTALELHRNQIDSALYVLQKFNLIGLEKRSSQYFYYVQKGTSDRVNFAFKADGMQRHDITSIKIAVHEFYDNAKGQDRTHRRRMNILSPKLDGREQ